MGKNTSVTLFASYAAWYGNIIIFKKKEREKIVEMYLLKGKTKKKEKENKKSNFHTLCFWEYVLILLFFIVGVFCV